MSEADNKTVGRRIVEAINTGNVAEIDALFADNHVEHGAPPGVPPTKEGLKSVLMALRAAFPDLKYTVEDEVAEGDFLVQRVTGHGTQSGPLFHFPASGKHAMWSEIHMGRIVGGKFTEHWANVDQVGMMVQLGHVKPPGG